MHILSNNDTIERARADIADIDIQIAKLISERTDAAEKIGIVKNELGLPVRDPDVEKKVLERYDGLADDFGLPRDKMESIARLLIETAIDREERTQKNRGV